MVLQASWSAECCATLKTCVRFLLIGVDLLHVLPEIIGGSEIFIAVRTNGSLLSFLSAHALLRTGISDSELGFAF